MSTIDNSLSSPHALSPDEISTLRNLLLDQLNLSGGDDADDAENLLDYAMDMIDAGENVGHVCEEVR